MKRFVLTSILGLVLAGAAAADASPVYSCPDGSAQCNGQTFAVWIADSGVNAGGNFFDVSVSINTGGYTGDEGDRAHGIEFKNVIDTNNLYQNLQLLSAPGGTGNWTPSTANLNPGQDCAGGAKNDTGCAVWTSSGGGYDFTIGDILTWTFRFNATSLGDGGAHLKYYYTDTYSNGKWNLVAGLLSEDLRLQDCRNGLCDPPTTAPEPATLTMLGLGLAGTAGAMRRRRKARAQS